MKQVVAYASLSVWVLMVGVIAFGIRMEGWGATSTVTATVTAQNIALSVTSGSIAYGNIAVSSQNSTTPGQANAQQVVTNSGNTTETFNVQGTASAAWTLSTAPGSEVYQHQFSTSGVSPWTWTNLSSASYKEAARNIAVNATKPLDFWLWTPSSTATFTTQNVNVTVQAVIYP